MTKPLDRDRAKKPAEAKEPPRADACDRLMSKRFNPTELLAQTPIPYLRRIAENGSVPRSMLEHLAFHSDPGVREAVADNANTPMDTLWALAADECADVRYAMAENHNIPLPILSALCEDTNPYVASRANTTMNRVLGGTVILGGFNDCGWQHKQTSFG